MSLSNSDLYRRFARGDTTGKANRMTIKQVADLPRDDVDSLPDAATVAVGYGWAVYAARLPDGTVIVYDGWREWAKEVGKNAEATPRHITGLEQYADVVSDERPQADDPPAELLEHLKGHHGHLNRIKSGGRF